MSKIKLEINKQYLVFTKKEYDNGIKVKIISNKAYSVLTDDEKTKTDTLVSNEKITEPVGSAAEKVDYFKNKVIIICQKLPITDPIVTVCIWDSIIDYDKTAELDLKKKYILDITLSVNNDNTPNDIINKIKSLSTDVYNGNVTIGVSNIVTDTETLSEYQSLVEHKKQLTSFLESIKKMKIDTESLKNLNDIVKTMESLNVRTRNIFYVT